MNTLDRTWWNKGPPLSPFSLRAQRTSAVVNSGERILPVAEGTNRLEQCPHNITVT